MSDAGPSALLDLEAAIAADVEWRRAHALAAWIRAFLDLPTMEAQAEYLGRIAQRHGEAIGREVAVGALVERYRGMVDGGRRPQELQEYLARVQREMGWAIADKVRDRLAEQMWRGTNKNGRNEDAQAGDPAHAALVPGGTLPR